MRDLATRFVVSVLGHIGEDNSFQELLERVVPSSPNFGKLFGVQGYILENDPLQFVCGFPMKTKWVKKDEDTALSYT